MAKDLCGFLSFGGSNDGIRGGFGDALQLGMVKLEEKH